MGKKPLSACYVPSTVLSAFCCVSSFKPHKDLTKWVRLLFPGPQKGSRLPEGTDPAEIRPLLQLQPFSVLRPKLDSGCPGPLALLTAGVRRRLESRGSGRGSSFLLAPVPASGAPAAALGELLRAFQSQPPCSPEDHQQPEI